MARLWTLSLWLTALGVAAGAQTVDLVPRIEPGSNWQLRIEKSRQGTRADGTSVTDAELRIREAGPEATRLSWVYGETQIDSPVADNPMVRAMSESLVGLTLEIALSAPYYEVELENEAEVRSRVEGAVSELTASLVASVPEESRPMMQAAMERLLTPEVILQSALKDAQLYLALSGLALETGEEIRAPEKMPNPLGGPDFESEIVISLREVDEAAGAAVVDWRQEFDPETTAAGVQGAIQGAVPEAGAVQLGGMTVRDAVEYTIDLGSGLPSEVRYQRDIEAGNQSRTDKTVIVVTERSVSP